MEPPRETEASKLIRRERERRAKAAKLSETSKPDMSSKEQSTSGGQTQLADHTISISDDDDRN